LTAESGRLQVLDWAGYGNDGGQSMFAQYVKRYPQNKPQFTYMTNESDALAKLHAGLKPDLFRPYVGWVKYFATSGLVQPWDTSMCPRLDETARREVLTQRHTGGRDPAWRPAWSFASASDSFVM